MLPVNSWGPQALVRPVLLYGCGTWGLTAALTKKLCARHCRHLQVMAGYRWPKRIRNKAIFHLTQTRSLSDDIQRARLRLLGHCLRLPRDAPSQKVLDLSVHAVPKAGRGRPRTCLLSTLRLELDTVGLNLRTASGLEQLLYVSMQWTETIYSA